MSPWRILDADESHLPAIFEIYNHEILTSPSTFETEPRTPQQQREWFHAHDRSLYPVIVAAEAGRVLGWARLQPWSPRPGYRRSAEDSVYIAEHARGKGVGRALLDELLRRAARAGIRTVIARINDDGGPSVRLHRSAGFRTIGILQEVGEKFGQILDVRIMQAIVRADAGDRREEPAGGRSC